MKNTAILYTILLLVAVRLFPSCQKEINFPAQVNAPTGPVLAWSFTHNGAKFEGCVNSAYYEMTNGIKTLSIKGNDIPGNSISLLIPVPDGKLTAGSTYTAAQGAALSVDDKNGNTHISNSSASSFSFTVTAITDTSITGSFTASLSDTSNANYVITNGNIKALIGKDNICIQNAGSGSGSNSGGTSSYSLIASGPNCSDVQIRGNYSTGSALGDTNTVSLKVNVSKIGTWSMTTATVNGMKFSGSGTFTTTGNQTIVLKGAGTPKDVGSIAFPVVTANSNCTFYIPVITSGTAPCNPANNTAEFSGVSSDSYSSVFHDANSSFGGYTITANGSTTGISLQFPGPKAPTPGIYHVKPVGGVKAVDDVAVYAVASNVLWQSSQGNVYVTVTNGKITAVICGVSFTGSLGGPAFTTKLTARITEN